MDKKNPFFKYNIPSVSFLERARNNIEVFDEEEKPEFLFYAALELRYGIEARLNEYIDASMKRQKNSPKRIKEYSASKLLKILAGLEPESKNHSRLTISIPGTNISSTLEYTPVTQELASAYGKLGEILHFKFFRNNPHWYYKDRIIEDLGDKSLLDYRDLLISFSNELEAANRGILLAPPPNFLYQLEKLKEAGEI